MEKLVEQLQKEQQSLKKAKADKEEEFKELTLQIQALKKAKVNPMTLSMNKQMMAALQEENEMLKQKLEETDRTMRR